MGKHKVRIGFIGCGGISNGHADRLLRNPDAEIVALNDIDPGRIKAFRERHPETEGCPTFTDYRDMLDSVEMDAVEIHTPHTLHFEQAMKALERGLHVLVEKPMVCSSDHAKELISKAEETGRVLLVSYQRHYQPQFMYIKEMIDSGRLGEIQFISALQCQGWKRATSGTWRQDPSLSGGGQVNDSGSHLIDIILWTTGLSPSEVSAFVDNLGTPVDINSAISLKFSNGAQGNISIVGDAPCWWEDITFWGSEGAIFYRNGRLVYVAHGRKPSEPKRFPPGSDPDTNFVNAILGREEVRSPGICGLRVIELTESIWEAGRDGHVVKVGGRSA